MSVDVFLIYIYNIHTYSTCPMCHCEIKKIMGVYHWICSHFLFSMFYIYVVNLAFIS